MPLEAPFGASLGDWLPPEDGLESLPAYLEKRKDLFLASPETGENDWYEYCRALDRHFDRMSNFLKSNELKFQNLVFGNIQSGKTAHLLANICWAKDNQIDLVILFSGSTTPLNDQTYERLGSDLPTGTAYIRPVPTETSESQLLNLSDELYQVVTQRFSAINDPIPVLVMLKNATRLAAMDSVLSKLQDRFDERLSILIVDDEADQASPDATLRQGSRPRPNTVGGRQPRTTHGGIGGLASTIQGKRIYLSYTATPQALMHGELQNLLQPQFCSVIPAGTEYVGIREVVNASNVLTSTFEMAGSDVTLTEDEMNICALEATFAEFLVLSWLHKRHSNVFHGFSETDGRICHEDSVQFLIHPSSAQADHYDYELQIRELVTAWISDLSSVRTRQTFITEIFLPAYARVFAKLGGSQGFDFEESSVQRDCLNYVFLLLKHRNALEIKRVNSNRRAELRREGREREFLPSKPSEWRGKDWILIGGDILGRGLTIPHLVCTFFLRNPQNPNFDIALQQMRFCGYRRSYVRLMRICAPRDIVDDYSDAAQIELLVRRRAVKWDETNRDLLANPPLIRFEAPTTARYRPTRNAVMSVDITTKDIGNSGFFGFRYIADPEGFDNNSSAILEIFNSDQAFTNSDGFDIYTMNSSDILTCLGRFNAHPSDQADFQPFLELLGYSDQEGGLGNCDIKFVLDETLRHFLAKDFRQTVTVEQARGYRYSRSVLHSELGAEAKWRNGESGPELQALRVQTLVGTPERKVPDLFPESVCVHARLYALFVNADSKAEPIGWGISLIGWTPTKRTQMWIHEDAI